MKHWQPVTFDVLVNTAKTYNDHVTYGQLTEAVQGTTGITYKALVQNWVGGLLAPVFRRCMAEGLPPLTSLCVNADGTVGKGYREVIERTGRTVPATLDELDDIAASDRLECYRFFGATLPPGGGEATLTPGVREARARKAKAEQLERPVALCPIHNIALPATGRCDMCD